MIKSWHEIALEEIERGTKLKIAHSILEEQNEILKKALSFYASASHPEYSDYSANDYDNNLRLSSGELARKALKECEGIK